MKTLKLLFVTILLFSVGIILWQHSNNEDTDILLLPQHAKTIYKVQNDIYAPNAPTFKVVTYFKSTAVGELNKWITSVIKYPEIDFLFYCTDSKYQQLPDYLKTIDFPANVYAISDKKLKDSEYLLICYVVDKDNKLIEITNPTIAEFDDLLQKLK